MRLTEKVRPDVVWEDAERELSQFFRSYADGPEGRGRLSQVRRALGAIRAARSLPVLTAEFSDSLEGRLIRDGLAHLRRRTHKTGFIRTSLHGVASVLILPAVPGAYSTGSSKQTVRRKSRAAEAAGVSWARVDDDAERRRLVALSEVRERDHPVERYRAADVDNSRLLDLGLWLVAYAEDGRPVLMAAVPVDGDWAMLTYFRTLEDTSTASNTRYLMSAVLADELAGRGVRYLVDTLTMSNLSDGLRHFQRMLGYRVVRIELLPTVHRHASRTSTG